MSKSVSETLDHLALLPPLLSLARQMQITRMDAAFKNGWRTPEELCQKYRAWHASLAKDQDRDVRLNEYSRTCTLFIEEIRANGGFAKEWSSLDPITLFGEIVNGERMGDGTLISIASKTNQ